MINPAPIDIEIAELASVLGNATRVLIMRVLLRRGPCTVGELVADLPQSQATVSEHLRLLRSVGLVTARRHGRSVRVEAEPLVMRRLSSLLAGVAVSAGPGARSGTIG